MLLSDPSFKEFNMHCKKTSEIFHWNELEDTQWNTKIYWDR